MNLLKGVMMEPKLIHLPEPKLTFSYKQKMEDPRDGLTMFGPFSKDRLSGAVNIGIIGPNEQRDYVKDYLERIHQPVISLESDIARPYFPGLEAVFNIYINLLAIEEIDIPQSHISDLMKYRDNYQRIFHLTNLYADRLRKYYNEEHAHITVWFVAIPDEVYLYGKPKSRIPYADDNIKARLTKKEQKMKMDFLFDDLNALQEAYEFEVNFHNQLKAKILNEKIVTQLIRESTVAYDRLWIEANKIEYERKFDSAKAWNISTALYYKAGGIPWKMGEVRRNVCYLGFVYKLIELGQDKDKVLCAAQMFLDSGDGMVFRRGPGNWHDPKTNEFHLKKSDAQDLLSLSLESFKEKSEAGDYPTEMFIHAKTYFNDEEWEGFSEAAEGKSEIIGVRIRNDGVFKLYRDLSYCIPRGATLILNNKFAYLWTKGFIPRLQTQIGSETPNPLSVEITRGEQDIKTVCKDILALTKLNYNSCIFADGLPVTLRFADSIGEILTAGKDIKSDVLPFKHYV